MEYGHFEQFFLDFLYFLFWKKNLSTTINQKYTALVQG